eukprot:3404022-Pyramimonas_sp.AAC.1
MAQGGLQVAQEASKTTQEALRGHKKWPRHSNSSSPLDAGGLRRSLFQAPSSPPGRGLSLLLIR